MKSLKQIFIISLVPIFAANCDENPVEEQPEETEIEEASKEYSEKDPRFYLQKVLDHPIVGERAKKFQIIELPPERNILEYTETSFRDEEPQIFYQRTQKNDLNERNLIKTSTTDTFRIVSGKLDKTDSTLINYEYGIPGRANTITKKTTDLTMIDHIGGTGPSTTQTIDEFTYQYDELNVYPLSYNWDRYYDERKMLSNTSFSFDPETNTEGKKYLKYGEDGEVSETKEYTTKYYGFMNSIKESHTEKSENGLQTHEAIIEEEKWVGYKLKSKTKLKETETETIVTIAEECRFISDDILKCESLRKTNGEPVEKISYERKIFITVEHDTYNFRKLIINQKSYSFDENGEKLALKVSSNYDEKMSLVERKTERFDGGDEPTSVEVKTLEYDPNTFTLLKSTTTTDGKVTKTIDYKYGEPVVID